MASWGKWNSTMQRSIYLTPQWRVEHLGGPPRERGRYAAHLFLVCNKRLYVATIADAKVSMVACEPNLLLLSRNLSRN